MAVVWYMGPSTIIVPARWKQRNVFFSHSTLGGVTNGTFRLRVAVWSSLDVIPPRPPVGVTSTLRQVIDPTLGGRVFTKGKPLPGSLNTSEGLLAWNRRHALVVVPTVYPAIPFAERLLSGAELLAALDVPGVRLKAASKDLRQQWGRELKLPFKVWAELFDWLYRLLGTPAIGMLPGPAGLKRALPLGMVGPEAKRSRGVGADRQVSGGLVPRREASSALLVSPDLDIHGAQKAAKADDAKVLVHLWNERAREGSHTKPDDRELDLLRTWALRYWKRLIAREFGRQCKWWREEAKGGKAVNLDAIRKGADALGFAAESTWWDWPRGSATFFWNWPPEYQTLIRDGLAPRFIGDPPRFRRPQRTNKNEQQHIWEREKVSNARGKRYITPTDRTIDSLMHYFSVPKVTIYHEETKEEEVLEIRMVYNGTNCGLNQVLWAPWFALPTGEQMLRTVAPGFWGGDNDYGDMFLNFWLHIDLQRYCGVDLTTLFPEELDGTHKTMLWEVWARPPMGVKPSPYQAVQGALVVKRVGLGDPADTNNVFQWDRLDLNLPGSETYSPGEPWVSKRRLDGLIAVDVHSYVDNERVTAPTRELAWQGSSKLAKLRADERQTNFT